MENFFIKNSYFIDGYFLCQFSASYGNLSESPGRKLTHMNDAIGAVGSFQISNGQVKEFQRNFIAKISLNKS